MENSDQTFSQADVAGELNPGTHTQVDVDSVSSEVAASKEQAEAKQKKNRDSLQTIKSAIIISGIVVALAGAAFAITKKLREK